MDPQTRGLKKELPHYMAKIENHPRGLFYSLNEAFWCMDYNPRNPRSLQSPILEKIRKNLQKISLSEKWAFLVFFLNFFSSKWDLAESWGILRCNQCIKTLQCSPLPVCHLLYVTHHLLHVTCHVSCVMCLMSCGMCQMTSLLTNW